MKKALFLLSLLSLGTAAHASNLLECTPDQVSTGLEAVYLSAGHGGGLRANVEVNVPFDNYISGDYKVRMTGPATYEGEGFKLTLDPASERSGQLAGRLDAYVPAQDGYPGEHVRAKVACKKGD